MTPTSSRTLLDALRFHIEMRPDQPAYTFLKDGETEERTIRYRELDMESRALAVMLQEWRIQRPLLIYPSGLDFITAFFACMYAGVTPIPAGLPHVTRIGRSLGRLSAIALDAKADAVLSTARVIERATGDPEFVDRAPELARMRWLATDGVDPGAAPAWCEPSPRKETAFIQYTSGSTSAPKGVLVSHRGLMHNLSFCNTVEKNDETTISVSWLPHSHDMGLIEAILLPAYAGYRAYLMSPAAFLRRPSRWLQAITRFGATNSGGPNFAFDLCVDRIAPEEQQSLDLSSWKVAYNGAETIRKETLLRFAAKFRPSGFRWNSFYPVYGLAESTLLVTSGGRADGPVFQDLDSEALGRGFATPRCEPERKTTTAVACGRTSPDTQIVITDPETLLPCEPHVVGEIWLCGPSAADGYWQRPAETNRVFRARLSEDADRIFLRTGDLGFLRDGNLFVTGRIKDVINIRGFKHYPQDIERTVENSHPSIYSNGCAALAVHCDGTEQLALVAEVRPRSFDGAVDWQQPLIAIIREAVTANHGIAVHSVALAPYGTIPKTTSGKLQRHACRRSLLDGTLELLDVWSPS